MRSTRLLVVLVSLLVTLTPLAADEERDQVLLAVFQAARTLAPDDDEWAQAYVQIAKIMRHTCDEDRSHGLKPRIYCNAQEGINRLSRSVKK